MIAVYCLNKARGTICDAEAMTEGAAVGMVYDICV